MVGMMVDLKDGQKVCLMVEKKVVQLACPKADYLVGYLVASKVVWMGLH